MEFLQIIGIGLGESIKGVWNGKFDTLSFWIRCMKVNVIYAKFFQAVALHYDLTSEIHTIPYTEEEMCYPKDIPVKGVIGSGLISIVFEGELDGVPIVIKTKRKNIEQRVNSSLITMGCWVKWINRIIPCPILTRSYDDICENFKIQLDFVEEYKNQMMFIDMYKNLSYVRIPKLYSDLCNSDQLVMTKLEGIPIAQLSEEEKIQTTNWMAKLCIHSLMKYGCSHSDMHAGNLIFNKDSIGVIDFGFILKLNEEEKDIFYHLMKDFAMDNLEGAALQTIRMTAPLEVQQNLTLDEVKDISRFIIHVYKSANSVHRFFSVYDILQINKKLNVYQLGISSVFYKVIVGLNSVEGVLSKLSATTADFIICAITDSED
jgi:predicted unusual protein kinase regulating ubiquinone biosynthesis (AarF/ABC1/UbiB family)